MQIIEIGRSEVSYEGMTLYLSKLVLRLENVGHRLREKAGREEGQSLVEYAIAVALIAVAAMAAIQALGGGIANLFTRLLGHIQGIG